MSCPVCSHLLVHCLKACWRCQKILLNMFFFLGSTVAELMEVMVSEKSWYGAWSVGVQKKKALFFLSLLKWLLCYIYSLINCWKSKVEAYLVIIKLRMLNGEILPRSKLSEGSRCCMWLPTFSFSQQYCSYSWTNLALTPSVIVCAMPIFCL